MTTRLIAVQMLVSDKLLKNVSHLVEAKTERELLESAEDLEMIATFLKRKLIESLLEEEKEPITE